MKQSQARPGFVETFRVPAPAPKTPWLDCDTAPAISGRYSKRVRIDAVIREASAILADAESGQIGIYASAWGGEFFGYVIKEHDGSIRFEAPESANAV